MAKIIDVPAALIMKIDKPYIEVYRSSESTNNPYKVGDREHLASLYCEIVIKTRDKLLIPNALKDKYWEKNLDIKLGMISYLGFPLLWPNNEVFGTICVLDSKENNYSKEYEDLILQFKETIESHLNLLYKNRKLENLIAIHKETEHQLLESEKKFKTLSNELETIIDIMPSFIAYKDTNNNFIRVNKYLADAQNMTKEEMEGKSCFDLYPPEDAQKYWEDDLEIIKSGKPKLNIEEPWESEEGTRWVSFSKIPYVDENGETKRILGIATDITEKKLAEEELKKHREHLEELVEEKTKKLRESGEKYRDLINNISDVIVELDREGKIIYISPRIFDLFGYHHEEVTGLSAFDFIHPEDISKVTEIMKQAIESGVVLSLEFKLQHKDGYYNPVSVRGSAIKANEKIKYVAVIRDITKSKQAELELRLKDQAIQSSISSFAISNLEGKIIYVNPAFLNNWMYDEEEILGETLLKLVDNEKKVTQTIEIVQKEGSYKGEIVAKRKDGSRFLANIQASLVFDNKGVPIGMCGSFLDITKRRKAEEELRKSEEKYRLITATSIDSIYQLDYNGNLLYINYAGAKMYGYKPEEMIGMNFAFLMTKDRLPEGAKYVEKVLAGQKVRGELFVKNKKGDEFPIYFSMVPVKENDDIVGFVGISRDISDRIQAEEELRKYREMLETLIEERTEKLKLAMEGLKRSNAELEQFAYVASHDLQEPLRMVASFTQLLEKRYKDKLDDDANDFINFIIDGTSRMQSLINDLLIFSRAGTYAKSFEPTDINIVLENVLTNLRQSIQETNAIITNDPLPVIIADDSQMMQVFQNLISNAIKFHGEEPPRIHISGEIYEHEWVFSVSDNGIGIDSKNFNRIFIIFQRLHKRDEYEGTGIGLAVCKKIIQRHGGKIWVESEPEKGSTFYFSIPKREAVKNEF